MLCPYMGVLMGFFGIFWRTPVKPGHLLLCISTTKPCAVSPHVFLVSILPRRYGKTLLGSPSPPPSSLWQFPPPSLLPHPAPPKNNTHAAYHCGWPVCIAEVWRIHEGVDEPLPVAKEEERRLRGSRRWRRGGSAPRRTDRLGCYRRRPGVTGSCWCQLT